MSDVTVKLNWDGSLRFTGINASGVETVIDGSRQSGASPVELLTQALGACVAIDVVTILEKQKTPAERLEIVLDGHRHTPEPRYLTEVKIMFDVWGDGIKPEKLVRAVTLSIGKYCSVYHSLRPDLRLRSEFRIHAAGAEAAGEYQVVEMATPTGELQ
jgi:putative redox protein